MKERILLFALVLGVLAVPGAANAQAGAMLTLRHLQSDQFPTITGFFEARDASGAQTTDIQVEDLSVLEDGASLPMGQIRLSSTGLNLYVVVDPSQAFAIRNAEGTRRFDLVKEELISWARPLSDGENWRLSLVTSDGVFSQQEGPSAWVEAVQEYEAPSEVLENDLQAFGLTLGLAGQDSVEPGMGTAIFLIASVPPTEQLTTLGEWQTQLIDEGITLFIWLIDAPSRLNTEESQALQALATATGGQAFTFTQDEAFPDLDSYFEPLRQAFFFQYDSQALSSGEHTVQLQWETDSGTVVSETDSFELEVLAPNPIFVTPPAQIERLPYENDPQLLAPFSQPLEILIEFPDKIERQVVRSTLYANGQAVAENTSPPFNNFIWDLRPYDISQEVLLQVEVEDELGLVGRSLEQPIEITAQQPASFWQSLLARGAPALAFSVVLIAAGAVFLVLVLSGRIQPPALQTTQLDEEDEDDPLAGSPLPPSSLDPDEALAMPAPRALAYLQRLDETGMVRADAVVPVTMEEVQIGSAAEVNQIILEEESVDPEHASLTRLDTGHFVLADRGSEAGTWLNYAPVSSEGSRVEEGDLVHIGRVAFRFSLLPTLRRQ